MPTLPVPLCALALLLAVGCTTADGGGGTWTGVADTLPSGQVVVTNPATPMWTDADAWQMTEDLRIGTIEGTGPDLFGDVIALAVDGAGRIYVLEGQAQEIRVFDTGGGYVRTIGRRGGGPGEFNQAVYLALGPDGHLWVVDPQNNRVSVFDTAGAYIEGHQMPGGFIIRPWPGRFDTAGRYYSPVPRPSAEEFDMGLARFDADLNPLDTLQIPSDPVQRERFELRRGDFGWMTSIPFTASFDWQLSPAGTFWGMLTGEYRFFELTADGDTVKTITRAFEPLPVTEADMEAARARLEWFIQQGGQVDWSRIPDEKPATSDFFVDADGYLWVTPVTAPEAPPQLDVFDSDGRYLGRMTVPGRLGYTRPLVIGDLLYGVVQDELEVPFVVRWRIARP